MRIYLAGPDVFLADAKAIGAKRACVQGWLQRLLSA